MNRFSLLLAIIATLASSCSNVQVNTVRIDRQIRQTDTIGTDGIISGINNVELEADSLFDIRIFGADGNRLYGISADNILAVFSTDGKILHRYDGIGRGPYEFLSASSLYFDPWKKEVLIYDWANKILRLDSSLKPTDETINGLTPFLGGITPIGDGAYAATLLSSVQREYAILLLDRDFNITGHLFPIANDVQKSGDGLIFAESIPVYNSLPIYRPAGEDTFYALEDNSLIPYLRVEMGRYEMPEELMSAVTDDNGISDYFYINYETIAGRYYFVNYVYPKEMCVFYDIFDMNTGERLSHCIYTEDDAVKGTPEGFIFRLEGTTYRMLPQYVKDNTLYCSVFDENGGTTLYILTLV